MDYVGELKVFERIQEKIETNEYTKPLSQRVLCFWNPWANPKAWRNKNQEAFLVLIALEGPKKVLESWKGTLVPITTMSTLFLNITVPLALDPGDFSDDVTRNIFGFLMVTSTLMSICATIVSTFMYAQCELCDVSDNKLLFLDRLENHENMIIITSNIWAIAGIIVSLMAMVIKATDIYGTWMSVYFGLFSTVLIKYTVVDLYTSVVSRRVGLQRERFNQILDQLIKG